MRCRWREALQGNDNDPVLGAILEFRVVSQLEQRRCAGLRSYRSTDPDHERGAGRADRADPDRCSGAHAAWSSSAGPVMAISRDPTTGQCTPDCPEVVFNFPWTIKINGQEAHSMNANRISL